MATPSIAILATLDTKGAEAAFLADCVQSHGCGALIVDTGVTGEPAAAANITREQVATAGGSSLNNLLDHPSRETAAPIMAEGARKLIHDLAEKGEVHGVIGLGGTQGTTLCTMVMRDLPYGFPKVMVSTMASGDVSRWVDIKDITMMFSVADILGLNPLTRKILGNAAGAVCGMAQSKIALQRGEKPLVAVTTVGITTKGAMEAVKVIERAGYETITFHAIGAGGRAMEQLMREGVIGAVLDYSTIEISNQMFGALLAADDDRLTTAGKLGLPQVICPGAVEVLVYGPPESVPEPFNTRTLIRHSPQITDVRLNSEEMHRVGCELARRLSHTRGRAVFMIPTEGYDSYATQGGGFHDPAADQAMVDALRNHLPANVELVTRPTDIESPEFANEAAEMLIELIHQHENALAGSKHG